MSRHPVGPGSPHGLPDPGLSKTTKPPDGERPLPLALDRPTPPEGQTRYTTENRHARQPLPKDSALGLPPGPIYSRIIKALRDAWLDGLVETAEEEETLMREMLAHGD